MKKLLSILFVFFSLFGYSQTYKDFKVGDTVYNPRSLESGLGVIITPIDTNSCKVKWFNGTVSTAYYGFITPKHYNPNKASNVSVISDSAIVRLLKKFDSLKVTYIELYCMPKADISTFIVGKNIRETFTIYIGLPFSETKLGFETSFRYPMDALNFVAKHGWHLVSVYAVTLNSLDIRHYELERVGK